MQVIDIVILTAVAAAAVGIIRWKQKQKRTGGGGCCGNCSACGMTCSPSEQENLQ